MFDCHKDMTAFHNEKVTLTGTDRTEMHDRRNAGRTRLNNGLTRSDHGLPDHHSQGSYAMHTMVQDADCDYDIDDGAYFNREDLQDDNDNDLTPEQAKERVRAALEDDRLLYPAKIHNNCVRQPYPQGYHIDIPVYRTIVQRDDEGNRTETYELASSDEWQVSDAREVTRWFKRCVSDLTDEGGRQLRHVVRLTKAFARSRKDWKAKTCSGIILTRLLCDEFAAVPARDDEALRKTWQAISTRLAKSLEVRHPVNDGNLADDGDAAVAFFRDKIDWALGKLAIFDGVCTRAEARKAWDEVFDSNFFGKQPVPTSGNGGNDGGKAAAFKVDETKNDRRNDGGGMYG
jgi:hypothetical protein